MVLKIAIPGKMQFKMMRREPYLLHRKGDVHYIGGAEVLPPPLPSEQENQVIGDLGTEYEDEAKAILIEHNLRLVVYIAKKFDNTGVGVEDLISIGTIGLIIYQRPYLREFLGCPGSECSEYQHVSISIPVATMTTK